MTSADLQPTNRSRPSGEEPADGQWWADAELPQSWPSLFEERLISEQDGEVGDLRGSVLENPAWHG